MNEENEKNILKRAKTSVKLRHSIKMKIMFLVGLTVFLSVNAILLIFESYSQNIIKKQMQNYLLDITLSSGTILEEMIKEKGVNVTLGYDSLESAFKDIGLEGIESSYAYIVDKESIMKYHPDKNKVGQPVENQVVKDLIAQINAGKRPESETVTYEFKGVTKYSAYYVTKNNAAVVVVCADEDEILVPVYNMAKIGLLLVVFVSIISIIIGYFVTRKFVRPIENIAVVIGNMAHLDFTVDDNMDKLAARKDETGVMSKAVAQLRKELISIVSSIQSNSEQLFAASDKLNDNTRDTANTIEQVENAVSDIATGATSQAEETQSATENIVEMGNMISNTAREVEILKNNSEQVHNSSDEAHDILNQLIKVNDKTKISVQEIYEQTNTTNESALKIKEATEIITSIAEETNLLSLNASIEAARAGEQGRGFAVVASQIQKLAEQSSESALRIQKITDMLISDSAKAVETMQVVKDNIGIQNEKMIGTENKFKDVNEGILSSINGIVQIADMAGNLNIVRERVVDGVQNLSAIAEENAASSEETSASVTQVSNVIIDISENADRLKSIAEQLDKEMKNFKL